VKGKQAGELVERGWHYTISPSLSVSRARALRVRIVLNHVEIQLLRLAE